MVLLAESGDDVVVTYLTGLLYTRIVEEFNKLPKERLEKIQSRVNIIDISGSSMDLFNLPEFAPAFEALYRSTPLTCLTSKREFSGLPKPTLAIVDPVLPYVNAGIRKVASSEEVPMLCWKSVNIGITMLEWTPKDSFGGNLELWETADKQTKEDPVDFASRTFYGVKGDAISRIPGYPPIYDYERFPQEIGMDPKLNIIALYSAWKNITASQGIVSISTSVLEKEAAEAFREYLRQSGKDFYLLGFVSGGIPLPKGDADAETLNFLSKMQKEHGEKSVIYISFGTNFWPSDPAKLYAVIDELIDSRHPFFLVCPSPFASVPDDVISKIRGSGIGYFTKWASQESILQHPATGWFITHCGWNSVQEAFRYRVPMICWPMAVDQPFNAVLITLKHRAGFELISVRTGDKGMRRPYRFEQNAPEPQFTVEAVKNEFRQVLSKLSGEEGRLVRQNADRISGSIDELWEGSGEASLDFGRLLKKYV
ncbi:hypothetical protein V5O48_001462 [Marasmius crinis-equi]|uniref:Glycosyltransferase family 1 protein n=1 Tax=Marasmius crinis-equi TaxID=585013 RepID=A0ABR3FYF4_9AGAR